jgi:hypothetical protein
MACRIDPLAMSFACAFVALLRLPKPAYYAPRRLPRLRIKLQDRLQPLEAASGAFVTPQRLQCPCHILVHYPIER